MNVYPFTEAERKRSRLQDGRRALRRPNLLGRGAEKGLGQAP